MIERWEHRNVFETYLMMGPGRSYRRLSEETGHNVNKLKDWGKQFGWAAKLEEKDKLAVQLIEKENEHLYVNTVKRRHQQAYQTIQEKALRQLTKKGVRFDTDKDAAIALDIGVKGERQILGLNDSKIRAAINGQGFAAIVEALLVGN